MPTVPDFNYELSLLPKGCHYLLGFDEVGRGPLAGPVTVGAFLIDLTTFDPQIFINLNIRDSKLLSASQRQKITNFFQSFGFSFSVFSASNLDIDQQGIADVLKNLFTKALKHYGSKAPFCLIDGNCNFNLTNTKSIIKGDQKCFSIAAASICAKVSRDQLMDSYHQQYPVYDFIHNKGYGTKSHLSALQSHGPCPIHRRSFRPVSSFLASVD